MTDLSRRLFLNQIGMGAASAAALAATGCATTGAAAGGTGGGKKSLTGPWLNLLENPEDNMIAYARLQGNLDSSKVKYGWYKGKDFPARACCPKPTGSASTRFCVR
jgi:hypothetical protein